MKGQYLAIETVLTFGMGIAVAIGTIAVFTNYKTTVLETAESRQAQKTSSQVRNAVFHLKSADSGFIDLETPDTLGGGDYSLALDGGVKIITDDQTYFTEFNGLKNQYDFSGSTSGGTVKLYKREDKFILRSN